MNKYGECTEKVAVKARNTQTRTSVARTRKRKGGEGRGREGATWEALTYTREQKEKAIKGEKGQGSEAEMTRWGKLG